VRKPQIHSSVKQDYCTPQYVLDWVRRLGRITLDPTAHDNPCMHFADYCATKSFDGLAMDWTKPMASGVTYVNSEYGRALPKWVDKCAQEQVRHGIEVVQLVPARAGNRWWRAARAKAHAMVELHKRITFVGAPDPAPFPSAMFYYGDRPYLFCHLFQDLGDVRVRRVGM
jgi:hypothetical protein